MAEFNMNQYLEQESDSTLMGALSASFHGPETEPDYDCFISQSNGFFALNIALQGPPDSPPFLARMFCRNGKLGRFGICLTKETKKGWVKLSGMVNVRYGDIVEWSNKSIRNLGLIDENGKILKLTMCLSCPKFERVLKQYLKTRQWDYIRQYIAL